MTDNEQSNGEEAPEEAGTGAEGPKDSHWLRNTAVVVATVPVLAALLEAFGVPVLETALKRLPGEGSPVAAASAPADPAAAAEGCAPARAPDRSAPAGLATTVVHTEGLGLNTFCGPGNHYARGEPENLPEGTAITVVCQVRDGQTVFDNADVPERHQEPWPVWDKLSNGSWVSDLYVDTPKEPGAEPPEGIGLCADLNP